MTQSIWLVRHGNRQDFADPTWSRTALRPQDPALSPDGLLQAIALAKRLEGQEIDRIFASPFLRTIETAQQVASILQLSFSLEAGLGEVLSSQLFDRQPQLLSIQSVQQFYSSLDLSYQSQCSVTYPETYEEAIARIGQIVQTLVTVHEGESLLLIGHKITVMAGVWQLLGKRCPLQTPLSGITLLQRRPQGWFLKCDGDISHLQR